MAIKTLIYFGDDRNAAVEKAAELRKPGHDVYLRSANDWLGDVENVGAVIVLASGDRADLITKAYGPLVRDPIVDDDTLDPGLSKDADIRANAARHTPVVVGPAEDRNALAINEGRKSKTENPAIGTPQEQAVEQVKKAGPAVETSAIEAVVQTNAAQIEALQPAVPASTQPSGTTETPAAAADAGTKPASPAAATSTGPATAAKSTK